MINLGHMNYVVMHGLSMVKHDDVILVYFRFQLDPVVSGPESPPGVSPVPAEQRQASRSAGHQVVPQQGPLLL